MLHVRVAQPFAFSANAGSEIENAAPEVTVRSDAMLDRLRLAPPILHRHERIPNSGNSSSAHPLSSCSRPPTLIT
jgi:hypothetical protein